MITFTRYVGTSPGTTTMALGGLGAEAVEWSTQQLVPGTVTPPPPPPAKRARTYRDIPIKSTSSKSSPMMGAWNPYAGVIELRGGKTLWPWGIFALMTGLAFAGGLFFWSRRG